MTPLEDLDPFEFDNIIADGNLTNDDFLMLASYLIGYMRDIHDTKDKGAKE